MKKQVEGSYTTKKEALQTIQKLKESGYSKDEILLVANKDIRDSFTKEMDISTASESSISGENEDDRSFWEKVKDAFTVEEPSEKNSEEDPLYSYHDDLDKGNIIILVNEKKDIDEPYRAKPAITGADRGLLSEDEDSDINDSMGAVTSSGTGEDGVSVRRATTDDIEESKLKNDLPGRDGDVFHTDQLSSSKNDLNQTLHLDEAVDSDTSDVIGTEDTMHANPDVPTDKTDVLDRSSLSTDKISPELEHPIDEEVTHLNETVSQNEPLETKGLNIDVGKENIGTSEEDDMNKHI